MIDRRILLTRPLSLRQTYGALQNGHGDPCVRFDASGFWRASRTPDGAVTTLLQLESSADLRVRAWGAGASWFDAHLTEFLGDHTDELPIADPEIARLAHEFSGMRIPRVLSLGELAVPIILGQRVTTREAFSAYRRIVVALGEPAPGPSIVPVRLPPEASTLAARPSWWFHRFGVERKRAEAIRTICARRHAVRRIEASPSGEARELLLALPGVGLWTAGILGLYGLGDHDAVIIGDFHFPNHVAWALAGEPRGDDKRMLELLEPFRGQRGRVLRLVLMGLPGAPKFGPRYNPLPLASM